MIYFSIFEISKMYFVIQCGKGEEKQHSLLPGREVQTDETSLEQQFINIHQNLKTNTSYIT